MITHRDKTGWLYGSLRPLIITSPPQSRSSANKMSSKLLGSHSPSMLSPFKTSLAEWHSARLGVSAYPSVCRCTLSHSKMSDCYSYSLHGRIAMLRLFCCVFALEFLFNPQFNLEPDYIVDFNDTFCIGNYCKLFTHVSIIDQYAISALYSTQTANSPSPLTISTKI